MCEPVAKPGSPLDYQHYFCAEESGNADQIKANEPKRLAFYRQTAAFQRAFANLANELEQAGYSAAEIVAIKGEVDHYTKARDEVRLASGDYIDLKMYEPAMRHLIDTYIRAEESSKLSAFDDFSLIQLIVERGPGVVGALPGDVAKDQKAVAEVIENNVRRLIINESPIDPAYYERMSKLLDALIAERRKAAISYEEYLKKIATLTREVASPDSDKSYPASVNSPAKRALFNNLGRSEVLALAVDRAIQTYRQDGWRENPIKTNRVRGAIKAALQSEAEKTEAILSLAKNHNEY